MSEWICRLLPILNCDQTGSSGSIPEIKVEPTGGVGDFQSAVPEPGAALLFALGLGVLAVTFRRYRKRKVS